jgi:hypothetical protein
MLTSLQRAPKVRPRVLVCYRSLRLRHLWGDPDPDFPLILGRDPDGSLLLLDGRHRLARARELGRQVIFAFYLSQHETADIRRFQPWDRPPPPALDAFRRSEDKPTLPIVWATRRYSVPSSWADIEGIAYVGVETIRVVCSEK